MKKAISYSLCFVLIVTILTGCGPSKKLPADQRRKLINDMETDTLTRLYDQQPGLKEKMNDGTRGFPYDNRRESIVH